MDLYSIKLFLGVVIIAFALFLLVIIYLLNSIRSLIIAQNLSISSIVIMMANELDYPLMDSDGNPIDEEDEEKS